MKKRTETKTFFDVAFFKFTISTLLKKVSIYIAFAAYLFLILIFTVITPLSSQTNPITIISNPLMALFLVFSMAVIGCFISIEIFRTSIDDGTELLIVSKPLSRLEIIFVKYIIFIICILFISLIGSLLSTASFSSVNSYVMDNVNIILGVFVGSFVCGLLFGSLAIILSIYLRKVISMLLSIAIAFILMVYSLLSTFVVENPVKVMSNGQDSITPISIINYEDTKENKKNNKMSLIQGVIPSIYGLESKTAEQIWNEAKSRSNYQIAGIFDFGAQLGSIFSLNNPPKDSLQALINLSTFNSPIDINFFKYDLNDDNSQKGLFLRFPSFDIDVDKIDNITNPSDKETLKNLLSNYNNSSRKISKFIGIKNNSSSISTSNSRLWGNSIDYSYGDFVNADVNVNLWDNAWNKIVKTRVNGADKFLPIKEIVDMRVNQERKQYYEAKKWKEDSSTAGINMPPYPDWIPSYLNTNKEIESYINSWTSVNKLTSPAQIFLEEYAKSFNLSKFNTSSFIREINSIILSSFYKYTKWSVYDQFNTNNEIDVLNILDITKDIDNDVVVSDIYPYFDTVTEENNKEMYLLIQAIKELYKELDTNSNEELTGNTRFSKIQELMLRNKDLKAFFEKKAATRNEYRTILQLQGINFPQILEKRNVNLLNYFTSEISSTGQTTIVVNIEGFQALASSSERIRFNYYVGNNPNGGELVKNINEFNKWNEDNWTFSFYSSSRLLPVSYANGFMQINAYNIINKDILIPVWVFLSLIMSIIGITLYSRRDFA